MRNVFIEGSSDRFEIARVMIQVIVHEHMQIQENLRQLDITEVNPFPGPQLLLPVPVVYSDAIIGYNG